MPKPYTRIRYCTLQAHHEAPSFPRLRSFKDYRALRVATMQQRLVSRDAGMTDCNRCTEDIASDSSIDCSCSIAAGDQSDV